ncbi:Hpt domain-containing protein [Paenibacillus sp.]|uniref:Hpt domain-containing protein n=1 Tax=Paenibacillus sp. TaxID=58172 RepID=UPI002D76049B|nr:Hpt domain-containing protein [Paenibacillus sp.]HZG57776.1 Hpt domain-containing protein [Paenibacillus sp.]
MTNDERYRRILEATRTLFLDELRAKSADIANAVHRWREGALSDDALVEHLYRQTHTLKGVALTVGFEDVHAVAEAVSAFKYRHEETPLQDAELELLVSKALELRAYR